MESSQFDYESGAELSSEMHPRQRFHEFNANET